VVNLDRLDDVIVPSLVTGLALLLVARPLSVFLTLLPFPTTWRQQLFLSWAGLRGAVPIVLATIPVAARAPGTENLFELVFLLVVVFTLVQAPVLPSVARWLKVHGEGAQDVELESSPLGRIGAEVLHVSIGKDSKMSGVALFELRLPVGANVTLIVRGDDTLVPDTRRVLGQGVELVLVVTYAVR
jgi:cell volume regulation protein A